jgi:uncharacterized protein
LEIKTPMRTAKDRLAAIRSPAEPRQKTKRPRRTKEAAKSKASPATTGAGWGGPRQGAGRKPGPARPPAEPKKDPGAWSPQAVAEMAIIASQLRERTEQRSTARPAFSIAQFPPQAMPPKNLRMAMDDNLGWAASGQWGGELAAATFQSLDQEGLIFLGYPYLAELAQRPEYRVISETIADDATRKWIDFDVKGAED